MLNVKGNMRNRTNKITKVVSYRQVNKNYEKIVKIYV